MTEAERVLTHHHEFVCVNVTKSLLKPSKLLHSFFHYLFETNFLRNLLTEIPCVKNNVLNSAESTFFWISAGLFLFNFGIILSQLLTLTSDVEVK